MEIVSDVSSRGRVAALAESLLSICDAVPEREVGSYKLTFRNNGVAVTIYVGFDDEQSGAAMVITSMTTFPEECCGMGYGSRALQQLLAWAHTQHMSEIQAVQVQRPSVRFWMRNGFVGLGNVTNDFRYIRA